MSEIIDEVSGAVIKRRWHKWQYGWQKWLAVVKFIDRIWPKNA